ncbi:MAG TPA: nucleotidyl transferase AbiEii/AbiGii toxin family protein [Polyangiaceae bacterium]
MSTVELPPSIPRDQLAEACREVAGEQRLQPAAVEKDYYLTRLITALAAQLGSGILLKGGTLLSKVDLGFNRMSEDVDLVLPGTPDVRKRSNAKRVDVLRSALLRVRQPVGVDVPMPYGERQDKDSHVTWTLRYDSEFGPQRIIVEASIRPVMLPPRRAQLGQLLKTNDAPFGYCWALDALEARAEKVRAAFTRRAIRDYYDLDQLERAGKDFSSAEFLALVNAKLAELDALPMASQSPAFGMTPSERATLQRAAREELPTVLRMDDPPFDLDGMLARFDALWAKERNRTKR